MLQAERDVAKKYGGIARPRNAKGVIVTDSPDMIIRRLKQAKAHKKTQVTKPKDHKKTQVTKPKSYKLTPTHHWDEVDDDDRLFMRDMVLHVPDMTDTPTQQFKKLNRFTDDVPITVHRADSTNSNPKYTEQRGYRINCQTCVVAYEARLRGYNVEAKAYQKTGIQSKMATFSRYKDGVITQFGSNAIATQIRIDSSNGVAADKLLRSYVPKVGSRFVMEVGWNDSHGRLASGHIVNVDAIPVGDGSNFELVVIDAQSGYVGALDHWVHVHRSHLNEYITLARVDDQPINPSVITALANS